MAAPELTMLSTRSYIRTMMMMMMIMNVMMVMMTVMATITVMMMLMATILGCIGWMQPCRWQRAAREEEQITSNMKMLKEKDIQVKVVTF